MFVNRLGVYIGLTENITAERFRYPFDDLVWLFLYVDFDAVSLTFH
ncbi:hypothetical protein ISN44_As05g060040 [Arabidopsis suecica]|uniref:Uncharacterized protein n=1 Tax=Arabidopsis suecica TaxID=45249 RepID=A0A8T2DQ54_ARASU|nr:hypothetical protein ISN44_As05g060040 [Arabidopsis suecica]